MRRKYLCGLLAAVIVTAGLWGITTLTCDKSTKAGAASQKETGAKSYYTCPMHPDIHAESPGKCPDCGMDLVLQKTGVSTDENKGGSYTCPMHPEIRSETPGKCPACGMDLVLQKTGASTDENKGGSYTCPMHPEIHSETPGKCPDCGMDLIQTTMPAKQPENEKGETYYTCPMHPSVHSDHPGACPVCTMSLVRKSGANVMESVEEQTSLTLSDRQRQLANISTARVETRSFSPAINAVGSVSYAEPGYGLICMRFPARIEKLYVTYTGQYVHKGDPVANVYSPEAIIAQQKYVASMVASQDPNEYRKWVRPSYFPKSVRILKLELQQLGFTEAQIYSLEERADIDSIFTVYSPISGTVVKKNVEQQQYVDIGTPIFEVADLSTVWIFLDVYEQDLRFLRLGQAVYITAEAYPGETFTGRVTFIDPVLSPDTRTIRVRTEFHNRDGRLKPNMYVNAAIETPLLTGLVAPRSAVLRTGKASVVWVEVEENTFAPRHVTVGATCGEETLIISGLNEGDRIAVTGGFLLDAESALASPNTTAFIN